MYNMLLVRCSLLYCFYLEFLVISCFREETLFFSQLGVEPQAVQPIAQFSVYKYSQSQPTV